MESTTGLMSLNTVLNEMLSRVTPLIAQEALPLVQCFGRILASDTVSPLDVPRFDNSAVDGYVVHLVDIASGQPLPIAGRSFAGQPCHGEWPAGACICTMTGAPVPEGCEAVVMQEQTRQIDNGACSTAEVHDGQNTRRRGEGISVGAIVFPAGTRLITAELPAIVSLGITEVPMICKVHIMFPSTGDGLQLPGQPLGDDQIYDTSRLVVHPVLEQLGCEVIDSRIIRNDPRALRAAFIEADSQTNVVINSDGISVGEADYTKTILEELGEIVFWKLAIESGKPFALSKPNNSWFCGLSDNPVSATLTFYQLVQPLLAKLSGNIANGLPAHQRVRTASRLKKTSGRLDLQRSVLQRDADDGLEVTTTEHQGSRIFNSFSLGNCSIVLERDRGNMEVGGWMEVESFNALFGDL